MSHGSYWGMHRAESGSIASFQPTGRSVVQNQGFLGELCMNPLQGSLRFIGENSSQTKPGFRKQLHGTTIFL